MAFSLRVSHLPPMNFDEDERLAAFDFVIRVFVYVSVLVIMVLLVALMLKLIGFFDDAAAVVPAGGEFWTETSRLLPKEAPPIIYGACEEDEYGDVKSAGKFSRSSSSDDIYDGKLCVICYDQKRCCFFVPCGHRATCDQCAKRITEGEAKICPFCRTGIKKVRKLFSP